MESLDSIDQLSLPTSTKGFSVGYAKSNITPDFPVATAGYGKRKGKNFSFVLDSLFVRCMVFDNGIERVAIVSADLLIIPPLVTERLTKELPSIGFSINNTFLSATHTHNGIGNWSTGATTILYGAYEEKVVSMICDKIKQCIVSASKQLKPAHLNAGAIPVGHVVRNRLDKIDGEVDSLLRIVEVKYADSSKLVMVSFTAHATCLYAKDLMLSRDYPGGLVDKLEQSDYKFAMFLAGAVGSHGCTPPEYGSSCINWMAEEITEKFLSERTSLKPVRNSTLVMHRVPLLLGEAQAKILKDWRLRPFVFNAAFGDYPVYLTALRLGDVIMLGTPCDFSGELTPPLDTVAKRNNFQVMVTSFNGGYIGYITEDQYYDRDHFETRLMNWYGPGNGAYMVQCLSKLIEGLSD